MNQCPNCKRRMILGEKVEYGVAADNSYFCRHFIPEKDFEPFTQTFKRLLLQAKEDAKNKTTEAPTL